jgi:hypothetical protein
LEEERAALLFLMPGGINVHCARRNIGVAGSRVGGKTRDDVGKMFCQR